MDRGTQISEGASLPAELIDFLEDLRKAGYRIGIDEHLAVQRVVLEFSISAEHALTTGDLKRYIGPILCTSPAQQEQFDADFDSWFRDKDRSQPQAELLSPPVIPLEHAVHESRRARKLWAISVLCLISALVILAIISRGGSGEAEVGPAVSRPAQQPASEVVAPQPFFDIRLVAGVLTLLLAAATGAFWIWRRRRLRVFLNSRPSSEIPQVRELFVSTADLGVYDRETLRDAAYSLGRYTRMKSADIDVDRSLARTLEAGGVFCPVFAERSAVPEYLVLIDRAGAADQHAEYVDGLVNPLFQNDVSGTIFYFDGDPRQCFQRIHRPEQSAGPRTGHGLVVSERMNRLTPVRLQTVLELYPDHRLLVFSDGRGLFDPMTGETGPGVDLLETWEQRILFTPEPAAAWSGAEGTLADRGWIILPADEAGMAAAAAGLEGQPPTISDLRIAPRLADEIRVREHRWLERAEPDAATLHRLLSQLRYYLGESATLWLGVCAIYPALDWNLTLYLGKAVQDDDGNTLFSRAGLTALARLPWFRHGRMPDWLRVALLAQLPKRVEESARAVLQQFLFSAPAKVTGEGSFTLEIAIDDRHELDRFARSAIAALRKKSPPSSVLKDRVFASFLSGHNPGKLAVPLPRRVFEILRASAESARNRAETGTVLGQPTAVMYVVALSFLERFIGRLLTASTHKWSLFDQAEYPISVAVAIIGGILVDCLVGWKRSLQFAMASFACTAAIVAAFADLAPAWVLAPVAIGLPVARVALPVAIVAYCTNWNSLLGGLTLAFAARMLGVAVYSLAAGSPSLRRAGLLLAALAVVWVISRLPGHWQSTRLSRQQTPNQSGSRLLWVITICLASAAALSTAIANDGLRAMGVDLQYYLVGGTVALITGVVLYVNIRRDQSSGFAPGVIRLLVIVCLLALAQSLGGIAFTAVQGTMRVIPAVQVTLGQIWPLYAVAIVLTSVVFVWRMTANPGIGSTIGRIVRNRIWLLAAAMIPLALVSFGGASPLQGASALAAAFILIGMSNGLTYPAYDVVVTRVVPFGLLGTVFCIAEGVGCLIDTVQREIDIRPWGGFGLFISVAVLFYLFRRWLASNLWFDEPAAPVSDRDQKHTDISS